MKRNHKINGEDVAIDWNRDFLMVGPSVDGNAIYNMIGEDDNGVVYLADGFYIANELAEIKNIETV